MTGLAPHTLKIYPSVASLQCIQEFHLVGGTALSLQINHRLSEDLDFCKWVSGSSVKNGISYQTIRDELNEMFSGVDCNPMSFDQVDFRVYGVKVSFFNEIGCNVPPYTPVEIGGIRCVPVNVLCAMKIKTMFERNVFRDYYDVYCMVREGLVDFNSAIDSSIAYHPKLRRGGIVNRLTTWKKFKDEKLFSLLTPKYNVKARDIGEYFKGLT